MEPEIVVVGAGPAGAVAALNLAPFFHVLLVDKVANPTHRIGESLPAAANRLLSDMALFDAFLAQGHLPCRFVRSRWGGTDELAQDELWNLDGHGWHLDRSRFDEWLRNEAQRRGARLLTGVQWMRADRDVDGSARWRLSLASRGQALTVTAKFLVDASGRHSRLARVLGVERRAQDKLICGWLRGIDQQPSEETAGVGDICSESGGWWYTSPLPGQRRILAFCTDADLPEAAEARNAETLRRRLDRVPALHEKLTQAGFLPDGERGLCAASSVTQGAVAGDAWLAVGDAALAFDPLSSQGIFNALYTGLAGATAIFSHLRESDSQALDEYQTHLDRIGAAYRANRRAWYAQESRWPEAPFWRRRRQ